MCFFLFLRYYYWNVCVSNGDCLNLDYGQTGVTYIQLVSITLSVCLGSHSPVHTHIHTHIHTAVHIAVHTAIHTHIHTPVHSQAVVSTPLGDSRLRDVSCFGSYRVVSQHIVSHTAPCGVPCHTDIVLY